MIEKNENGAFHEMIYEYCPRQTENHIQSFCIQNELNSNTKAMIEKVFSFGSLNEERNAENFRHVNSQY